MGLIKAISSKILNVSAIDIFSEKLHFLSDVIICVLKMGMGKTESSTSDAPCN